MARTTAAKAAGPPESINDYIGRFPPPVRRVLRRVRSDIRRALPGASEAISYGMPAFKIDDRVVIYFAGWKEHYSIYPASVRMEAAFKEELASFEMSGKGTIRFPIAQPVPSTLIGRLARFRAKEASERARAAKKTTKTR